jgi:hypothetical protein
MNSIEPGVLRVGVYDTYFRYNQHSLTKLRECPPSFKWIDNCNDPSLVDVVLATQNSGGLLLGCAHPRKILYLQETSEFHGNRQIFMYEQFNLLLSNDKILVEWPTLQGRVLYQTLFGDWMEDRNIPAKTRLCSMVAGGNNFLSGHRIRHQVARAGIPGVDVLGSINGGPYVTTEAAYHPYRFNLAIENSNYPWWHTEKLFNAWAAKTVPIYWGCSDFSQLEKMGFDCSALIPWDGNLDQLRHILNTEPYEKHLAALETNYRRCAELYCHETTLEPAIRGFFDIV